MNDVNKEKEAIIITAENLRGKPIINNTIYWTRHHRHASMQSKLSRYYVISIIWDKKKWDLNFWKDIR